MSGIWEIVKRGGENNKRLNVSLVRTELTGVAMGLRTRAAAKANIEDRFGRELTTEETADLVAIADQFETGTVQDRIVYALKLEMTLNAAELGLVEEAGFRSVLGIS